MIRWPETILVATAPIDLRLSFDRLAGIVREQLGATRVIELAPKYWTETLCRLDARQRAILSRPWEVALAATELAETLAHAA